MPAILPETAAELAECLTGFGGRKQQVNLFGNGSKRMMAGPVPHDSPTVSTVRLCRILQYEPADLTISAEAGMRWPDLQKTLAANRQMIALDPPFASEATVGGVIATNGSGPLRRGYGTARDLVIGMSFVVPDGRIIKSGGMVVKNVAGLDMAKLMIGSFGSLAAITSVNFRVHSMPEQTRSFVFSCVSIEECMEKRNAILQSALQPEAIDFFSPVAAARLDLRGHALAIRAGGSRGVLDRYTRELSGAAVLEGKDESELWRRVRDFTPEFLRRNPSGVVARVSTKIQELRAVLKATSGPVVTRAAAGVNYVYFNSGQLVAPFWKTAAERDWRAVIEFAPDEFRGSRELWLGSDDAGFDMMKKIKLMFDPENVLNRGRMYGRI
jgi:glycolate oxidase FAD binding subunit